MLRFSDFFLQILAQIWPSKIPEVKGCYLDYNYLNSNNNTGMYVLRITADEINSMTRDLILRKCRAW